MLTASEILQELSRDMNKLERFGVDEIGLFGSYVEDRQTEKSDIDFLVKFKPGNKTFDHYMDLKFYLEDLFQREIDLVTVESVKPDLRQYILRSVVYAKGA